MDNFLIKIKDIPEAGLSCDWPLPWAMLEDAASGLPVERAQSQVRARLELHRQGENVFVSGTLSGQLGVACARCLAPVQMAVDAPARVVFTEQVPDDDDDEDGDVEFARYEGDTIDLGGLIRETLILMTPMAPLCRPDCKGLCPVCGGDRNELDCNCIVKMEDPRLAPLKGLKI